MIKQKELISDTLIRKWTNPQRARKINDLEKRKEIANKDIRENITKLIQDDWDQINAYFLQCDQKILSLRHFDNLKDAQELMKDAPPQQRAKYIKSIKDEYIDKYAALSKSTKRQEQENSNVQVSDDGVIEIVDKELDPGALYVSKYKDHPKIFRPSTSKRLEKLPPLITLNGCTFLTMGGTSMITAAAGKGKSAICLAICSKIINSEVDGLGFENPGGTIKRVIYFDGELDMHQGDDNFAQMMRRANVSDEVIDAKFRYIGTSLMEEYAERRLVIDEEIKEFKPQLVIIDGAADLILDPNDGVSTIKLKTWIRNLNAVHNIAVIVTIHPNPKDTKAQGHLGTKLWQECGSNVLIKWDKLGMGMITSDFEMGKRRNSPMEHLESLYKYDFDQKMLVSCNKPNPIGGRPSKDDLCELSDKDLWMMVDEWTAPMPFNAHIQRIKTYCQEHYPNYAIGRDKIIEFNLYLKKIKEMVYTRDDEKSKQVVYYTDPGKIEKK